MEDVDMQNCQSDAIWAQSVGLMADGLTVTDKVSLEQLKGTCLTLMEQIWSLTI